MLHLVQEVSREGIENADDKCMDIIDIAPYDVPELVRNPEEKVVEMRDGFH
jgi:hypothetical protein